MDRNRTGTRASIGSHPEPGAHGPEPPRTSGAFPLADSAWQPAPAEKRERMETIWVCVDGEILPEEKARLSPLDRGFLYGDGLFETMKARGNRVDFLGQHLERLRAGALALRLPFPTGFDFEGCVRQLLDKNGIRGEASIKICLSRGRHQGEISLYSPSRSTLVILASPTLGPSPDRWEQGLSLSVEPELRQNPSSPLCGLKSLNYLFHLVARTRARDRGFEEAILLNGAGEVCESTSANLFCFRQGRLQTPAPSCGLLPGVLRAALMKCLEEEGEPVAEVRLPAASLAECEEVFLTNSLLEIVPVGRIDEKAYPRRDRTRAVREAFLRYRDRPGER